MLTLFELNFNFFFIGRFLQLLVPVLLTIAFYTLGERKLMASMQRRLGPNVVGIFGFLQPFSDAVKLLFKEISIPKYSNSFLFLFAPLFFLFLSLSSWILLPFNEIILYDILFYNVERPSILFNFRQILGEVSFFSILYFGYQMTGMDYVIVMLREGFHEVPTFMLSYYQYTTYFMPYNVLLIFFISSLSIFGIIISGWASNSKYPFLGAIRSGAQMISYEIAIGFVLLFVVMLTGTFNFVEIIYYQNDFYLVFPLLPIFLIFLVCALAETNRVPFDLPEAEAELVAGYNLEYSSIMFAMFFLAEYSSMLIMCFLGVIFFFGGWETVNNIIIFYFIKLNIFFICYIWVRATLPRYRYDQLMDIGWKILLPLLLGFLYCLLLFLYLFNGFPYVLNDPFLLLYFLKI